MPISIHLAKTSITIFDKLRRLLNVQTSIRKRETEILITFRIYFDLVFIAVLNSTCNRSAMN